MAEKCLLFRRLILIQGLGGLTEASVSLGVAGLGLADRIGIGRYSRVV